MVTVHLAGWTCKYLLRIFLAAGYADEWIFDALTSPYIDAGDANSDWTGEPWPNGKRINMGAYGGTSQASMNGNIADLDVSGVVNFVDLAEFPNKWFAQEACMKDLTNNGVLTLLMLGFSLKTGSGSANSYSKCVQ